MKLSTKLLPLALSAALLLPSAPLGVFGDQTDAHAYIAPTADQEAAVSTPSDIDELPPITVDLVQWQDMDVSTRYNVLRPDGVITTNHIRFRLILSEDASDLDITLNGEMVAYEILGSIVTFTAGLIGGGHTLTVTTHKGDMAHTSSLYFRVAGDASYPTLDVETPSDIAVGQTRDFTLTGQNLDNVDTLTVQVALTRGAQVDAITMADGVSGVYTCYRGQLTLELRITDPSAIRDGVLVNVKVTASDTLPPDTELTWEVISTNVILNDSKGDDFISSFDPVDATLGVETRYTIKGETVAVIGRPVTVQVTDPVGNPSVGTALFAYDGTLLGTTDGEGKLATTYFKEKGECFIYARDDSGASSRPFRFLNYAPAGIEDGTPYALRYTGLSDTARSVAWMSHFIGSSPEAVLRLSTAEDMSDAVTHKGTSVLANYDETLTVNRLNSVELTGLIPGTTYYYTVGDGTVWSEILSFTVESTTDSTHVAILGDVTGLDNLLLEQLAETMHRDGVPYDLSLFAGPVIDNYNSYDALMGHMSLLSALPLGDVGIIYTLDRADADYNPSAAVAGNWKDYVVYEYGHVYVATLNYTDNLAMLERQLNALAQHARMSEAPWHILSVRYAPTVEDGGMDARFAKLVVALAERGGFDLVVSGETTGYSRTEPLYHGQPVEANGVTYIAIDTIGGEASENTAVASDYNAAYLSVSATADALEVRVMHAKSNGRAEVMDSYIAKHTVCDEGTHIYRNGILQDAYVCDLCNARTSIMGFTGLLAEENTYIFLGENQLLTGWQIYNGKWYYFPVSTMAAVGDGIVHIAGASYVFRDHVLVEGAWVEQDGHRKLLWAGQYLTGTWHTQAGKTYYFDENGYAVTDTCVLPVVNEQGETVMMTCVFNARGELQVRYA